MVTISLCMIVRDEEAVLDRCLASVKGLVDEIIVVLLYFLRLYKYALWFYGHFLQIGCLLVSLPMFSISSGIRIFLGHCVMHGILAHFWHHLTLSSIPMVSFLSAQ